MYITVILIFLNYQLSYCIADFDYINHLFIDRKVINNLRENILFSVMIENFFLV